MAEPTSNGPAGEAVLSSSASQSGSARPARLRRAQTSRFSAPEGARTTVWWVYDDGRLRRLAAPVIAVGTMPLAAYVGHFVAQSVLAVPVPGAAMRSRFFRRGPLEYLLYVATKPAQYTR